MLPRARGCRVINILEPVGSIPSSVIENLKTVHHGAQNELPETERQTRELSKAPPEEQAEVWQTAQEETESEQPTAKEIKQAGRPDCHPLTYRLKIC